MTFIEDNQILWQDFFLYTATDSTMSPNENGSVKHAKKDVQGLMMNKIFKKINLKEHD